MNSTILIIDDDQFLTKSLEKLLRAHGFSVVVSHSLEEGYAAIQVQAPELVILDLSLPDGDGVELCKKIRESFVFPILMLTSRGESMDKVIGLEVGADDYLIKPFDPHELIARVKALLRRHLTYSQENLSPGSLVVGALHLDLGSRTARVADKELSLTHTEYDLLAYMAQHSGIALHRDKIFDSVWGYSSEFSSNSLDVLMYRVRNKLRAVGAGDLITTVRGHGFKLQAPDLSMSSELN